MGKDVRRISQTGSAHSSQYTRDSALYCTQFFSTFGGSTLSPLFRTQSMTCVYKIQLGQCNGAALLLAA